MDRNPVPACHQSIVNENGDEQTTVTADQVSEFKKLGMERVRHGEWEG